MTNTKKITKQDLRLAKRIKKVRKEKGWTQEKLAERVRVSTTWIAYIENGYRRPNLKMVYRIANVLGVKVKDLIPF